MKTSRKKMLLSSIAMLLVALVALGSATYAWFTLNKTVSADNMQVQVAAAKGLQITGDNGANWGKTYSYAARTNKLSPASLDTSNGVGTKTVYAPAIDVDGKWSAAAAGATATFSEQDTIKPATSGEGVSATDDYMTAYEFGVKSSSGTLSNVTHTITITTTGKCTKYARVALVDQGADTTPTYGSSGSTVTATYGNQTSPTAFATAAAATAKTTTAQTLTSFTSGSAKQITTTLEATETAHYYTLLVWFEGEDADCTTAQADGTITISTEFSIA